MRNRGTWVAVFFVVATAVVTLIFDLALSDIFNALRMENRPLLGPRFTTSTLVAFALAAGTAFLCAFVYRPARFFIEQALGEMDKVHWPTWPETRVATFTVILTSTVAACILGVFDAVFSWLTANNLFLR